MAELPRGTVTFLFTDIEGSTRLWQTAPEAMSTAFPRQDALLRAACTAHGGVVYKTVGDALEAAFPAAPAAAAAAVAAQRALTAEAWPTPAPVRVRIALHTCQADPDLDGDYRTSGLNRLGRLLPAGHGGQVLLSQATMALARGALPAGVFPWDLGAHRLKDLLEPEPIYQLIIPDVASDFPPLRTLDARPHNLPLQPTPLVGREREVAAACTRLRRADLRLLTLTGPGGIGKTRLGLQVAADLSDDFADGVFFVPLAPVADPELVPAAITAALGIREAGERPLRELLLNEVGAKQLLLVLDNFEQVTTAAQFVADLLAAGARSKVLVTSRLPLHLRAEHQLAVPPLPLPARHPPPTAERLTQFEAVRLFIERAQAVREDFTVTNDNAPAVAEICHRLDGLPLAIELAAARVKLLPPAAMLARLESRLPLLTGGARDLPARQQTLRGAIAWSYDLLRPDERALFRRLALFAGGWTFAAAEAIAGSPGSGELELDVLEGLGLLVDHSLVREVEHVPPPDGVDAEPRFVMLETIREFGLEQLAASGEAEEAAQRFAAYVLRFAEAAAPALWGGAEQRAWSDRLEVERDNLRAVLTWANKHEPETAARLAATMWRFWLVRGPVSEGLSWLERLLAVGGNEEPTIRIALLDGSGTLAMDQGDYARAKTLLTEGLDLARAIADAGRSARMLLLLGNVTSFEGGSEDGAALYTEALALYRETGDTQGEGSVLNNLAEVARHRGDLEGATTHYEEALAITHQLGDETGIATVLFNLGTLDIERGDIAGASARLQDSLTRAVAIGDIFLIGNALVGYARVAERLGQALPATRLLGAIAAYQEHSGHSLQPSERELVEETEAALRPQLDESSFTAAWQAGHSLSLEEAVAEALGVEVPADV